jgi:hypothetical protein
MATTLAATCALILKALAKVAVARLLVLGIVP